MSELDYKEQLTRLIQRAMTGKSDDASYSREYLWNRYLMRKYGPSAKVNKERDNHSQYVTGEVQEAVTWALPQIIDSLLGGYEIVRLVPHTKEDEPLAELEGWIINHMIRQANHGRSVVALRNIVKDACIIGTAYGKVWVEETTDQSMKRSAYVGQEQFLQLMAGQEAGLVEIHKAESRPGPEGQRLYTVHWRQLTAGQPVLRISGVPPEEVFYDPDWTTLETRDAEWIIHRQRKTMSDLDSMGIDPALIDRVNLVDESGRDEWDSERQNREIYGDFDSFDALERGEKTVYLHEIWGNLDKDGQGKRRRHVMMVGDQILSDEEDSLCNLFALSPDPNPHLHLGLGYGDKITPLQERSTALWRQLLDNVYSQNSFKVLVYGNAIDNQRNAETALGNPETPIVKVNVPPQQAAMPLAIPSLVEKLLPVIEQARDAGLIRSGVSHISDADPEVLQRAQTGTAAAAAERRSRVLVDTIRMIAETGWIPMASIVRTLCLRTPGLVPTSLYRGGQWVHVDLSQWVNRDMQIEAGLGYSTQETQKTAMQTMFEYLEPLMGQGLVGPEHLHAMAAGLLSSMGEMLPDKYLYNPHDPQWQQGQAQKAQAAQAAQAKQDDIMERTVAVQEQKNSVDSNIGHRRLDLEEEKIDLEKLKLASTLPKEEAETIMTDAKTDLLAAQAVKTEAEAVEIEEGENGEAG